MGNKNLKLTSLDKYPVKALIICAISTTKDKDFRFWSQELCRKPYNIPSDCVFTLDQKTYKSKKHISYDLSGIWTGSKFDIVVVSTDSLYFLLEKKSSIYSDLFYFVKENGTFIVDPFFWGQSSAIEFDKICISSCPEYMKHLEKCTKNELHMFNDLCCIQSKKYGSKKDIIKKVRIFGISYLKGRYGHLFEKIHEKSCAYSEYLSVDFLIFSGFKGNRI